MYYMSTRGYLLNYFYMLCSLVIQDPCALSALPSYPRLSCKPCFSFVMHHVSPNWFLCSNMGGYCRLTYTSFISCQLGTFQVGTCLLHLVFMVFY